MTVINVEGVSFGYTDVPVVKDVTLTIKGGARACGTEWVGQDHIARAHARATPPR
jgi:ABC-type multidrug transport system fused ATPase/permease subunit